MLLSFQQVQVQRKRDPYAPSIAFSSLEGLPVLRYGRFHTSPFLVFSLLAFLGVYLHDDLDLVVSFKTSPSSSKSESGCKRYRIFRKRCFLPVIRSVQPTL